ncbi:MAG: proteasome assembly chaperone family protein [Candidatus Micrarchaeia archaeon]
MEKTKIYYNKKIKPRNPILIVGLPGIGNVGSLVAESIKKSLGAKKFATLYSPHFPHQVFMLKSGGVRMPSNRFYYWKNPSKSKDASDMIILTGDAQALAPEGQYEINEKIVRFFKLLKGKKIFTIGGSNTSNQYVSNPKVFGVTWSDKLRDELSKNGVLFGQITGMIWGSAGLIVTFAKKYKIDAACIMGETGMLDVDANSAKAVLGVVSKLLDIKVNSENLDKIKKETEKMVKAFEEAAESQGQQPSKENFTYIR